MRHGVKKAKFRSGIDANTMLMRKLVANFVRHGSIVTTQQKSQFIKPSIDRLVSHAKKDSNSSMNFLMSFFNSKELSMNLKSAAANAFKDRSSGFTSTVRLGRRASDGAMMVKMTWITPVILEEKKEAVSQSQSAVTEPRKEAISKKKVVKSSKPSTAKTKTGK